MEVKHEKSNVLEESVDTSTPPHLDPMFRPRLIMEDKEERGYGDAENNCSRISVHPRSFLRENTRKRLSFSLSSSSSSLQLKPHDSPYPFSCHMCSSTNVDLQALDSQWRILLLCNGCGDRIRSAAVCSYCFACFNALDFDVLTCRVCKCCIHLRCAPLQRGYIMFSEIDPASFTCIDCCAVPRPLSRNPTVTRTLSEDLIRIASSAAKKKAAFAAKARQKALKKAEEARLAMERAFDAILFARDAAVSDEKLALQLHLVMNGSPRILGEASPAKMDHETDSKKGCSYLKLKMKCRKSRKRKRIRLQEGFCAKGDAFSRSNDILLSKRKFFVKVGCAVGKELPNAVADCASGSMDLTLHEREDCHPGLVLNSYGDAKNDGLALISLRESADSNSCMEASVCRRGAGEGAGELQEEKRRAVHDRCHIKYFKRNSRSKGLIAANKLKLQSSCSGASTFADCKPTSTQGHSFPTSSGSVS